MTCILVSDTGSPGPEQLAVTTGLRGLTAMEVKILDPSKIFTRGAWWCYYEPSSGIDENLLINAR